MDLKNITFDWPRFWIVARYILLFIAVIVSRMYADDAASYCGSYCEASGEEFRSYGLNHCVCQNRISEPSIAENSTLFINKINLS